MPKLSHLKDLSKAQIKKAVVTIGFFDGLHLGHQKLLQEVVLRAKKLNGTSIVLTYTNHPLTVLKPNEVIETITTSKLRLSLIEKMGIDFVVGLPFTEELSQISPEKFILSLQKEIPLHTLLLGHDANIGKDRSGTKEVLHKLSKKLSFHLHYIEPVIIDHQTLSSSLIRKEIRNRHFDHLQKLLGRPYSITLPVITGRGHGKKTIGFSTANLSLQGLVHPPLGVYATSVLWKGTLYKSITNLGVAPTVRNDSAPLLEVHLIGEEIDLVGEEITVIFHSFIREEKKFATVDELKKQIAADIKMLS